MRMKSLLVLGLHVFVFLFWGTTASFAQECRASCADGYVCRLVYNQVLGGMESRCVSQAGAQLFGGSRSSQTKTATQALSECYSQCTDPNYTCNATNNERTNYVCQRINGSRTTNESTNNSGNNPSQAGGSVNCVSQYEALLQECVNQVEETSNDCDEKNDAGMNSVSATASQITLMMGQQTASSVQAACSKMANLTQAANAALAAYRLNCSNSIQSCRSKCNAVKQYVNSQASCLSIAGGSAVGYSDYMARADNEAKRCDNFENKVNEAQQAIQNYGLTSANASQCANLTSGTGALPEFCKTNPNYPGCSGVTPVDCSNAQVAATNKVCICSKNPSDPACSSAQKVGGGVTAGGGSIDSSSRLAAKADTTGIGGDIPGLDPIAQGKPNNSGGGEAVDGRQGNGSPLSGGGGGSGVSPQGGGGSGGGAMDPSGGGGGGFYGGGGGGRFGGSGGSGGGSGGGYRGAYGANNPAGTGGPDLRKFLPGGQFDPKRGISGMGGPDGITGPHSDIWQKVQNRYRVMSPTLLP